MRRITGSRSPARTVLPCLDAVLLLVGVITAARLRFGGQVFPDELAQILDHPGFLLYAVALQIGLATTFDLYRPESWRTQDYLLLRMAALSATLAAGLVLGVYLVLPWRFGRGLLLLTLVLTLPAQTAVRFLWLVVASLPHARRAVVIGDGPIVAALEEELRSRPNPPFVIDRHLPAVDRGPMESLSSQRSAADLVIVASLRDDSAVDTLAALNFRGTTVIDAAGAYAALTGRIPVRQVDSRWFIATGDFSSLASSPFHYLQRFLDVVIAFLLLVLSLPALLVAGIGILLSDGRPVLYRQIRVGRFGEPFVLYKFRTMLFNARGPTFAQPDDPRVLRFGRLLRRWRVDELPQLLNVLKGEMSLVGPRPERPRVARRLEEEIPFYAFRYSVRPGLTGWAQVNLEYCSDTADHVKKLEFDLYSLRHHGPALYAIVLLRTLGALVFRPGR